jgi:hypothetical protein
MKLRQQIMSPLDIVVLLKIITYKGEPWYQVLLANQLFISQSEVSKSLVRSKYARLLDEKGKQVFKMALLDFLQYGIRYVFPQQPGVMVRGIPTAHSAKPLSEIIQSDENYVWPSGRGTMRGYSVVPLYNSVVNAVQLDSQLHEILALVDAIRIGRAREKEIAVEELKKRIL